MKLAFSRSRVKALTLVEVLVVVVVLILLFLWLVPVTTRTSVKAPKIVCANNLKQIGLSFRLFATDHSDAFPMKVSTNKGGSKEFTSAAELFRHYQSMSNQLSTPKVLVCPADTRRPASSFTNLSNLNVSYFVALDSDETMPQMLLAGDRNLTTNGVQVPPGLLVLITNSVLGWSATMHNGSGNATLGDGSVQPFTPARLQDQISSMETGTNRLLIP